MRKTGLIAVIFALFLASCQGTAEQGELPTLASFPTETLTATVTQTTVPSNTPEPSETPLPSDTPTETEEPTITPTPSQTPIPTETPDNTQAAEGTATASILEAPIFSTFTPLPPGPINVPLRPTSSTPQVIADVVITEIQFREEVTRLIAQASGISQADLDFVAETGIEVKLTALSGDAFVTGTITIPFNFSGGSFNNIVMIGGLVGIEMQDNLEPSEDFLQHVTETVLIVQEAFNFILNQRLGEGNHNLEQIFITNEVMGIALLVPDPGQ